MILTPPTHREVVLALIVLSCAMIVLDISIMLTALPRLQADLGFTNAGLSWVSSIYTLFFGGFLLLGGKLGDLFGRRRMYMLGLAIFALASLAIGAAQSAGFIIAARAVQGLGAAMAPLTSVGVAAVEPRDVGAASGTVNVAHQMGSSLGLALLVALAALTSTAGNSAAAIAERTSHALMGGAFLVALAIVSKLFILRRPA
ncbi:MFS transporter [Aliiruegeria lutimaris]|nr:MFS transporter [Aliiruegeria lutimaris]